MTKLQGWIGLFLIVVGLVVAYSAFRYAVDQQAIADCAQWEEWSRYYAPWDEQAQTGYYITSFQYNECDSVGMAVDAYVYNKGM